MLRIILGVIVGFIAWSIMWIGSDQVLMMLWPEWYGTHQQDFQRAMTDKQPFTVDTAILAGHLVRTVIISIMAGFLAAFTANENRRTPLFLGILLLLFGIMVQAAAWNYLPLWYHLIFLALLVPMTNLGGKMKSESTPAPVLQGDGQGQPS